MNNSDPMYWIFPAVTLTIMVLILANSPPMVTIGFCVSVVLGIVYCFWKKYI